MPNELSAARKGGFSCYILKSKQKRRESKVGRPPSRAGCTPVQLGERMTGSHEVTSSSLVISTRTFRNLHESVNCGTFLCKKVPKKAGRFLLRQRVFEEISLFSPVFSPCGKRVFCPLKTPFFLFAEQINYTPVLFLCPCRILFSSLFCGREKTLSPPFFCGKSVFSYGGHYSSLPRVMPRMTRSVANMVTKASSKLMTRFWISPASK